MAPAFNAKSPTVRRIMREAAELSASPSPDYTATPLEADLFEWHFTMRGPPHSPYADGIYHGRIVLPPTYPLRPPSFRFFTPSGRFEPNREICLSISGHHEETWQPAWGLRTALVALRSFMASDAHGQLGGLDCPPAVRRRLAADSPAFRCPACARFNADIMAECAAAAAAASASAASASCAGSAEPAIPEGLKMGWRDEMAAPAAAAEDPSAGGAVDSETAELAEGFVQTAPSPPALAPRAEAEAPPPAPQQGLPQPTRTVPSPSPQRLAVAAATAEMRVRERAGQGVPMWVDRLIVILGVLLAGMVLKILLG